MFYVKHLDVAESETARCKEALAVYSDNQDNSNQYILVSDLNAAFPGASHLKFKPLDALPRTLSVIEEKILLLSWDQRSTLYAFKSATGKNNFSYNTDYFLKF
jgi:hypothetical protein